MSRREPEKEAAPGSLSEPALAGLIALRQFEVIRTLSVHRLLGPSVRRSHLRDCLIRAVLIEHGLGRVQPIAFYRKDCAGHGSGSAIRLELSRMAALGLVLIRDNDLDGRSSRVVPTQRLVDFMTAHVPKLIGQIKDLVR